MSRKQTILKILSIGIPLLLVVYLFAQFRISGDQWKDVVSSDGRGYYHYLIEYFVPAEDRDITAEQSYLTERDGNYYTKYPIGTSFLLAPFFGFGYLAALLFDYETTGLSYPFQVSTGIGALFYLLIGTWALFQLLRTFSISRKAAYFTAIVLVFGTNLLYYAVMGSTMSHVYSFAAINLFALFVRKSFIDLQQRHLFLAILCFALLILIRPFNGLVLLAIPALTADLSNPGERFKNLLAHRFAIFSGVVLTVVLLLLQLLAWYDQSGEWLLFSYAHEGFYFLRPEILNVLFSFNKGLFIYTPITLVALVGIWFWYRQNRSAALYFVAFFIILTYFISAWWCWNYSSGLGLRPYIDFYGLLAIPLGLMIHHTKRRLKYIVAGLLIIFTALSLIQSYQYAVLIMDHAGMNWKKYQHIFLRTGDIYIGSLGGSFDVPPYAPNGLELVNSYEALLDGDSLLIEDEFALTKTFEAGELPHSEILHWQISLEKKEGTQNSAENALIVFDFFEEDSTHHYTTIKINNVPCAPTGQWTSESYTLNTPAPTQNQSVKVYIWNPNRGRFSLRGYHLLLFRPN